MRLHYISWIYEGFSSALFDTNFKGYRKIDHPIIDETDDGRLSAGEYKRLVHVR
jgi:hypothetical protein